MKPYRVVLTKDARFLSDTFKRLIQKTDGVDVVGETEDLTSLPSLVEVTKADWVILFQRRTSSTHSNVELLLSKAPWIRVLTVAMDGSEVRMSWMTMHNRFCSVSSVEELISILTSDTPTLTFSPEEGTPNLRELSSTKGEQVVL
jgi:hypothetical protein